MTNTDVFTPNRLAYSDGSPDQGSYGIAALTGNDCHLVAQTTLVKHIDDPEYYEDLRLGMFCRDTIERLAILATGGFND
jgi:hypothetical protein